MLTATASTTLTADLIVANNHFYQLSGIPDNTYDVILLDLSASGSIVRKVVVDGNVVAGGSTGNYRSFINKAGAGTLEMVVATGNVMAGVINAGLFRNFRPERAMGNLDRYFNGTTTVVYRSDNGGRATFNGTGAQTAFSTPHLLAFTPDHITVTPGSSDARGDYYATADATNVTVTYATAPASGTGNVVLNWRAY
jgi:hypothetical protein